MDFCNTSWILFESEFQACKCIANLPRGPSAKQLAGTSKPLTVRHSGS